MYPNYLIGLMNGSSKHSAILKRKTDLTAGGGFINQNEFIKNVNGSEDLNDIVYKNAFDLNIFGAFALIVTWSKDRESIARVQYVDVRKIRITKEIDEKLNKEMYDRQQNGVDYFFISEDWDNVRKQKNKPMLMQGYSKEYNKDFPTQLLYVKEYRPGTEYYTLPDYISTVDWIELDKEVSNFHLKSVQNGFTPSMIINFNQGIPEDEEQAIISNKIKTKYAGTDNASNVFITFSDGSDSKPDFIPITLNDSDERFLMLEEHIMQNITTGHRIPPVIAGVQVEGKLGSTAEIIENEAIFQSQVINSKQALIERAYNKLYNNSVEKLKLKVVKTFEQEIKEVE